MYIIEARPIIVITIALAFFIIWAGWYLGDLNKRVKDIELDREPKKKRGNRTGVTVTVNECTNNCCGCELYKLVPCGKHGPLYCCVDGSEELVLGMGGPMAITPDWCKKGRSTQWMR